jgi:hypothetical protein
MLSQPGSWAQMVACPVCRSGGDRSHDSGSQGGSHHPIGRHARRIDVALTTDRERSARKNCVLADQLVWVSAAEGSAASRRPLSVALGTEGCGFRASAVEALNAAGIVWRSICQVGSLEPVFATLEADMAIAPFLSRTVPARLAVLKSKELPPLRHFFLNLRLAEGPGSASREAFVEHVRESFASRSN